MKKTLKMLCIAVLAISVLFVSCSKGSEDTGKTYFGYTDHSIDKNGRKRIYVSGYNLNIASALTNAIL